MRCLLIALLAAGCGDSIHPDEPRDASPDSETPTSPVPVEIALDTGAVEAVEADDVALLELSVHTDGRPVDADATVAIDAVALTATAGLDFADGHRVIDVPRGTANGAHLQIAISITDDLTVENAETFSVRLSRDGSTVEVDPTAETVVTIIDDDKLQHIGFRRHLTRVDLASGTETTVGAIGIRGVSDVLAMDTHPDNGWLYALSRGSELWRVDLADALWELVAPVAASNFSGMTFESSSVIWAHYSFDQSLFRIDLEAGETRRINGVFGTNVSDIAYDPTTDRLLGFHRNSVFLIDRTTAEATEIGRIRDATTGADMTPVYGCDIASTGVAYCVLLQGSVVSINLATFRSTLLPGRGLQQSEVALDASETALISAVDDRYSSLDLNDQSVSTGRLGFGFITTLTSAGEDGWLWTLQDGRLIAVALESGERRVGPVTDPDVDQLSRDPTTGALYGLRSRALSDAFVEIDPNTGSVAEIAIRTGSQFRPKTFTHHPTTGQIWVSSCCRIGRVVNGQIVELEQSRGYRQLVFTADGKLYGNLGRAFADEVHEIDLVTGVGTAVRKLPSTVLALGRDMNGALFGAAGGTISGSGHTFFTLDHESGRITTLDGIAGGVSGLAVDLARGRVYATAGEFLFLIDHRTGLATSQFELPLAPAGLAFDPETGLLWGVESGLSARLFTLDPESGVTAIIGDIGVLNPTSLTFAPGGLLASFGYNANSLFSVDRATGAGTLAPAPLGPDVARIVSLTPDDQGRLIGVDATGLVVEVDLTTGAANPINRISAPISGLSLQR